MEKNVSGKKQKFGHPIIQFLIFFFFLFCSILDCFFVQCLGLGTWSLCPLRQSIMDSEVRSWRSFLCCRHRPPVVIFIDADLLLHLIFLNPSFPPGKCVHWWHNFLFMKFCTSLLFWLTESESTKKLLSKQIPFVSVFICKLLMLNLVERTQQCFSLRTITCRLYVWRCDCTTFCSRTYLWFDFFQPAAWPPLFLLSDIS